METTEVESECPECRQRRERLQGIGVCVFLATILSCKTLGFVTVPITAALVFLSSRRCPTYRQGKTQTPAV